MDEEDGKESSPVDTELMDEEDGPGAAATISIRNQSHVTMQTPSSSAPPTSSTLASFADLCPPNHIGEVNQFVQGLTDLERYIPLPCFLFQKLIKRY